MTDSNKLRATGEPMPAWYEVRGQRSGRKLPDLHHVDADRPDMRTFCGVRVSVAVHRPIVRQADTCRACSKRTGAP